MDARRRIASTAMRMVPSVPFLKPTGHESPEASSPVSLAFGGARPDRAPADQVGDVRGLIRSRNSVPAGKSHVVDLQQQLRARFRPLLMRKLVEVRVVDQSLPADRGARLLEIHPHHDQQIVFQLIAYREQAVCIRSPPWGRVPSTGRSSPAGGHPRG